MNDSADIILEQLSAFMDGELPESETRFLLRRLDGDPALRARWARMQLAASCLKGQPVRAMSPALALAVGNVLAEEHVASRHRPLLRWGMAASVIALAVLLGPRLMPGQEPAPMPVASAPRPTPNIVASPGSADLVASGGGSANAPAAPRAATVRETARGTVSDLVAGVDEAASQESPIPLSEQSPADFPLIESGDKRSWPRSGLANVSNDPALEAYLVRHNQLLANDGLGGFVPYLDVVATGQAGPSVTEGERPADGSASGEANR